MRIESLDRITLPNILADNYSFIYLMPFWEFDCKWIDSKISFFVHLKLSNDINKKSSDYNGFRAIIFREIVLNAVVI